MSDSKNGGMPLSMWTYPWDVTDLGNEQVYHDLRDRAGLNMISIAASYHAGKFLQPRSPVRKCYYPQDGTVYFQPTEALWKDKTIRPRVAEHVLDHGDGLRRLVEDRREQGLKVSCWTVCLHNARLGMAHPEHVTRTAFGDANLFSLCPSSPAVQDYAATLVADMTATYRPDRVELETPGFMGFAHGYHHEKDGLAMTASEEFLLSVCFCDHCISAAQADGIPVEEARVTVRQLICDACERAVPCERFPDFPAAGIDAFAHFPAFHAYCLWREKPVTALVARIRAQAHPQSEIIVISGTEPWREGLDLRKVALACDGVLLCVYGETEAAIRRHVGAVRKDIGRDKSLVAGFRLFYPETASADTLAGYIGAATAAGADGVNFYNYGLVPAARLDWVRHAVDLLT